MTEARKLSVKLRLRRTRAQWALAGLTARGKARKRSPNGTRKPTIYVRKLRQRIFTLGEKQLGKRLRYYRSKGWTLSSDHALLLRGFRSLPRPRNPVRPNTPKAVKPVDARPEAPARLATNIREWWKLSDEQLGIPKEKPRRPFVAYWKRVA